MGLAKVLIFTGLFCLALGMLVMLASRIPGFDRLGRLPGDIRVEGKGYSFYFPIVTCLVLSALASLVLRFFQNGKS